jgi:hypothetical protein
LDGSLLCERSYRLSEATTIHLITSAALVTYKVVALVVGFLFAFLGYKLLVKGVSGEFKFSAEYKGVKADLISASPGIFFILTGTIVIGITLYKGLTFEELPVDRPPLSAPSGASESGKAPAFSLPSTPPLGGAGTNKGD